MCISPGVCQLRGKPSCSTFQHQMGYTAYGILTAGPEGGFPPSATRSLQTLHGGGGGGGGGDIGISPHKDVVQFRHLSGKVESC